MKVCKECIIPDSFPDVNFVNGKCTFCRNYSDFTKNRVYILGKERLLKVLKSEKKNKYDCLVPLSGGKDSSYVLFYIVNELELKPLAAYFDSGFSTEVSKRNIARLCKKLSVDLVIGKASKYRRKLVMESLKIARYKGRIGNICANCENNLRSFVINEALKRKIPFIIWGSTDFEELFSVFLKPNTPTFQEDFGKNIVNKMAKKASSAVAELSGPRVSLINKFRIVFYYFKIFYLRIRDNIEMKPPEGYRKLNPFLEVKFNGKDVKVVYFFNYIKYDPYKNIEILKKEVGWEAPYGKEIRSDCLIHHVVNYQHLMDTGITQDGFNLSVLVRSGHLTRIEAIEKEKLIKRDLKKDCKKLCEELGISIEEIFEI